MSGFLHAIIVYFVVSIVCTLIAYWVISPDLLVAFDYVPARALLSIFSGFMVGHAFLIASIFYTSKSYDAIISRSWLLFLSLIGLIATSKTFCFGSPPAIEANLATGIISFRWGANACTFDGYTFIELLIFTIAMLLIILLKFLSDDFIRQQGERMIMAIMRRMR
jgi:hypothetical protein